MSVTIEAAVDTSAVAKKKDPPVTPEGVDAELVGRLVEQARAAGLQLTGEGGLLQQLTKRVIEAALDGEITDHLGYEKHDPAGKDGGNSRNGCRAKKALTPVGEGVDDRGDQRAPGRGVWRRRVPADDLDDHRQGDGRHGRVAEPAVGSR